MVIRYRFQRLLAFCLALLILNMYSTVISAEPAQQPPLTAELSAFGRVSVNGAPATSGATIFTNSTLVTDDNSSAIINLGRLGRIEYLSKSVSTLSFAETSATATLDAGFARVLKPQGVSTSIITKEVTVLAGSGEPALFTVSLENGRTSVAVQQGHVELRTGRGTKQLAAGQQAAINQGGEATIQGRNSSGSGRHPGILLAIGAAIAVIAIVLGARGGSNNMNASGGGGQVSPSV